MARRFTDARALVDYLLDRHEAGIEQALAYPDHEGFVDIAGHDRFLRDLRAAQTGGGVELSFGKGRRAGQVAFVRLRDPDALYAHTGRVPTSATYADAVAEEVLAGTRAGTQAREAVGAALAAWKRNAPWTGVRPGDVASLRAAVLLASAIADGRHEGMDYRTFSRRTAGDSKALERLEAPVMRLLKSLGHDVATGVKPREALAREGLSKVSQPLLLSGRVRLGGAELPAAMPYLGCSPDSVAALSLPETPEYVLTIENYTSFVLYAQEADRARRGLALYVGGYPSSAIQKALTEIGGIVAACVPFYHWSDIDPDGVGIFLVVEKAVGRRLIPHMMDAETAERFGTAPAARPVRMPEAGGTLVEGLAAYLAGSDAKYLEQEDLDPVRPEGFQAS